MANPNVPVVPAMTTQQFMDMGKIPDFVRDVKPFTGDPTRLVDWLTDVDSIFRTYRDNGATQTQINVLERTVRRKIEGEAADILNANNIATDWNQIKNTLILYYRDQRDVKTLDYQLTSIKKSANENLNTYYSRVNELLSLIIAQVKTDDTLKLNSAAHITYFREKALDAFVRGLEKPLNILLKSTNPQTLGQAYNFCVEYQNMDIRSAPFRNEHGGQPVPKPRALPELPSSQPRIILAPPIPPRRSPFNPFSNHGPPPRQFPQATFQNLAPPPRQFSQPNPFRQTPQNNPFQNNPFQNNPFRNNPFRTNPFKSEPMEVDTSQQTKIVNYGNRPVMNLKRPHPPSQQFQSFKRQAHPLESIYPEYDPYGYYTDWYDYEHFDESYLNSDYCDDSYIQPNQLDEEIGEASGASNSEPVKSDPQVANFLEWRPRW